MDGIPLHQIGNQIKKSTEAIMELKVVEADLRGKRDNKPSSMKVLKSLLKIIEKRGISVIKYLIKRRIKKQKIRMLKYEIREVMKDKSIDESLRDRLLYKKKRRIRVIKYGKRKVK